MGSASEGMQAIVLESQALLELGRWLKDQAYRHTTVTPASHWRVNGRFGKAWGRNLQDIFGWNRPYRPEILPPECTSLMREAGIETVDGSAYRSALRASTLNGQLFFHSAFPTNAPDAVFFGPDTYRFAAAIRRFLDRGGPVRRAVDIGCGTGAGAVMLALACPQAEVHAVDINPQALQLCEINATLAGARNVQTRQSDLLSALSGDFDCIIANPPYLLDPAARAYRHGGGQRGEGLSTAIIDTALQRLAPGGRLLLYTGVAIVAGHDHFLAWVGKRLDGERCHWTYEELDPDVFGEELDQAGYQDVDRIAVVCLELSRPG
jgi:SAM-dependent methyltransferase